MGENRRNRTMLVVGAIAMGASFQASSTNGQEVGAEVSALAPQTTAYLAEATDKGATRMDLPVGSAHSASGPEAILHCLKCGTRYDISDPDPENWGSEHRFDSTGDLDRTCVDCHNEWRDGTCLYTHPPCGVTSIDGVREAVTTAVAARPHQDPGTALAEVVAAHPELRLASDGRELQLVACDGSTHQRWRVDMARGLVLHEVD